MNQTTPTRDEAVHAVAKIIDPGAFAEENHPYWMGHTRSETRINSATHKAREVMALLASAPAPASGRVDAVAVKALEWQADPFSEALIADTNGLGRYVITPYEGQFKVAGGNVRSLKPTVEAAQIKAQADYEQRIRSALSPAATPVSEAGGERKVAFFKDGKVEDAIAALAKPASSPAGGREALFEEALIGHFGTSTTTMFTAREAGRQAATVVRDLFVALSHSTSVGRVE
jgi:hypothetical protein